MSTVQTSKRPYRGRPLKNDDPTLQIQDMSADERGDLAILLHAEGLSWTQVAARMGYANGSSARNAALARALVHTPPTEEQRESTRARMLAQLTQIFTVVERKLASADQEERNTAIRQTLQIAEMYARWSGIMPSQTPMAAGVTRYGLAIRDGREEVKP